MARTKKTEKLGRGQREKKKSSKAQESAGYIVGLENVTKSISAAIKPPKKRPESRTIEGVSVEGPAREDILASTLNELRGIGEDSEDAETGTESTNLTEKEDGSEINEVDGNDKMSTGDAKNDDKVANEVTAPQKDLTPAYTTQAHNSSHTQKHSQSFIPLHDHVDAIINERQNKQTTDNQSGQISQLGLPNSDYRLPPPLKDSSRYDTNQYQNNNGQASHTHTNQVDHNIHGNQTQNTTFNNNSGASYGNIQQQHTQTFQQQFNQFINRQPQYPSMQQPYQDNFRHDFSQDQSMQSYGPHNYLDSLYPDQTMSHPSYNPPMPQYPIPHSMPQSYNDNATNNFSQGHSMNPNGPSNSIPPKHFYHNNAAMTNNSLQPDGQTNNNNVDKQNVQSMHTQNSHIATSSAPNVTVLGQVDQNGKLVPVSEADKTFLLDKNKSYQIIGEVNKQGQVVSQDTKIQSSSGRQNGGNISHGTSGIHEGSEIHNMDVGVSEGTLESYGAVGGSNFMEEQLHVENLSMDSQDDDPVLLTRDNNSSGHNRHSGQYTSVRNTGTGCSPSNSKSTGCSPTNSKSTGCSPSNSKSMGFSPSNSQSSGYTSSPQKRQGQNSHKKKIERGKGKGNKGKQLQKKQKKPQNKRKLEEAFPFCDAPQSQGTSPEVNNEKSPLVSDVEMMVIRVGESLNRSRQGNIDEQVAVNCQNIEVLTRMLEGLHLVMQARLSADQKKKLRDDMVWNVSSLIELTSERSTSLARLKVIIRALFNAADLINHSAMGRGKNRPKVPRGPRWDMMLECASELGVNEAGIINAVNAVCRQKTREFQGDTGEDESDAAEYSDSDADDEEEEQDNPHNQKRKKM